ncbi:hypothetical protein Nepgr_027219 [Nepenthes gracilis]|uniref:Uncharacterized protein n=1 Tax=Nepenthes gracilis TaxID=150966 RepID=A0AAD3TA48_NEPGR|nr:hypothetical protein Nepgr_027219 [Nepenthes gracilis]
MMLSGAASSAKLIEVKVAYHTVPSRLKSLPKVTGPAVGEGGCSIKPIPDQVLVNYASTDAGTSGKMVVSSPVCGGNALDDGATQQPCCPAIDVCSARGLVSTMPSQLIDSDPFQTSYAACAASAGDDSEEDGAPSGSLKDEPVIGVAIADQSVEVPSAEEPCCAPLSAGVVLPEVAGDVDVLASISKDELLVDQALDQASFLKRVRFAPEILSVEALSSVPHRRMLAPCSDIYHPVKFRRSNIGILASEDVPVDDGPNPGADIECHDLSFPPSDGATPEMEPASVIDPDIMPSPISRIALCRSNLCRSAFGLRGLDSDASPLGCDLLFAGVKLSGMHSLGVMFSRLELAGAGVQLSGVLFAEVHISGVPKPECFFPEFVLAGAKFSECNFSV